MKQVSKLSKPLHLQIELLEEQEFLEVQARPFTPMPWKPL